MSPIVRGFLSLSLILAAAPASAEQPKVEVMVFMDYECGFCRRFDATLDKLIDAHGDLLRVQIVNTPLPMHKDAETAALAVRAAAKQGRFWEMHKRLMHGAIDRASVQQHAAELGLNLDAFNRELESATARAMLAEESALGAKLGVKGTPTVFINGRKLIGARPFAELDQIIREALAQDPGNCEKGECECDEEK